MVPSCPLQPSLTQFCLWDSLRCWHLICGCRSLLQSRLLSLLCLVAVCALPVLSQVTVTADAPSAGGRLLVQKSLDHHATMAWNFARDNPINVTLTVINVGDAPAYDVVLEDSWASGFELSGSAGTNKWAEIAAGQQVSVSYFVTPTSEGEFESAPARITYQAKENGPEITGYSSSTTNLNVISAETFSRLTNTHVVEWSLFTGLLALFVLAPAYKWYELSSSYVKSGRRKVE
jgi:hypothetical protein